jgi:hypothetical protein
MKGAENDGTDFQNLHLSRPQQVLEGLVCFSPFPEQDLIRIAFLSISNSLNG